MSTGITSEIFALGWLGSNESRDNDCRLMRKFICVTEQVTNISRASLAEIVPRTVPENRENEISSSISRATENVERIPPSRTAENESHFSPNAAGKDARRTCTSFARQLFRAIVTDVCTRGSETRYFGLHNE